jgi:hypothetical protein
MCSLLRKPNQVTAADFIARKFLMEQWMFVLTSVFLEELKLYAPVVF